MQIQRKTKKIEKRENLESDAGLGIVWTLKIIFASSMCDGSGYSRGPGFPVVM